MSQSFAIQRTIRIAQIVMGIVFLLLAAAFFLRSPIAAAVWPWPGYNSGISGLSYTFVASVLAAFAIPILLIGLTGEIRAVVPITLDVIVVLVGSGLFMLQSYTINTNNQRPLVGAILCLVSLPAAFAVLWASRMPPVSWSVLSPTRSYSSFPISGCLKPACLTIAPA